jgi:RimJ/RimL family protein N-acetyltransferase
MSQLGPTPRMTSPSEAEPLQDPAADPEAARRNDLGQPIGAPLEHWTRRELPGRAPLEGLTCRLEALDAERHLGPLWQAVREDTQGRMWTYLPYGPFASLEAYRSWLLSTCTTPDPLFFALVERASGQALGLASFLRCAPDVGSIEVGHLQFSPRLQRTTLATEAMFLMMRRVFEELGYRRYEWKCDALNAPSRRAALRLGFRFEGVFRQATIYKGRNRDTAWYSILDAEWPALRDGFLSWLDASNFDADGTQRQPLSAFRSRSG